MPQVPTPLAAEEPASYRCGQKPCLGSLRGKPESGAEGVHRCLEGQPYGALSPGQGSRLEPIPDLPPGELDFHAWWRGVAGA